MSIKPGWLDDLLGAMHGLVWMATPAGELMHMQGTAERVYGYSVEELLARPRLWLERVHPADRKQVRGQLAGLAGPDQAELEYRIRRRDGEAAWLLNRARVMFDDSGRPARLEGLILDITARKTAELALRSDEALYRATVEDQTELIVRWRPDGTRTFVNEAYCRYFGRPRAELVGTSFLPLVHEEDREAVRAKLAALTPEQPALVDQHRVVRPDGTTGWQEWTDRAIFDTAGRLVELQSVGRDITEQKQLEAHLRQAQKMEAIGRLAGGIAHDFNNLLVPIIGYTDLALARLGPESDLARDLALVRQAAGRAADLTRQILAFSRKQVLAMETLDLNQVIHEFEKMLRRLIGEDIELQTYLAETVYPVRGDRAQLEQVLLNLALNARDAMPGGGKLTIETANVPLDAGYVRQHIEVEAGEYVMVAVSDTGQGMDAATREHIFEPFFTTKAVGQGTGLGLATAHGIIKQHGGNIYVYSEPGQGATFKLYLPRAQPGSSVPERPASQHVSLVGVETVLVVEDNDMVRRLVAETLGGHGYKMIEARHGREGYERALAAEQRIDLLLTDVVMPQMNGRELYERLAAALPGLKVLYMSGHTDNVIAHHGVLDKGAPFLQKPFTIQGLLEMVRRVLDE